MKANERERERERVRMKESKRERKCEREKERGRETSIIKLLYWSCLTIVMVTAIDDIRLLYIDKPSDVSTVDLYISYRILNYYI